MSLESRKAPPVRFAIRETQRPECMNENWTGRACWFSMMRLEEEQPQKRFSSPDVAIKRSLVLRSFSSTWSSQHNGAEDLDVAWQRQDATMSANSPCLLLMTTSVASSSFQRLLIRSHPYLRHLPTTKHYPMHLRHYLHCLKKSPHSLPPCLLYPTQC